MYFFFSSRRLHTRCALVTGVQTCALPICLDTDPQARRRANLRRLLSPRHVAFVGGQSVVDPIKLCRRAGFVGEIWAVNPKHAELAGAPCFPTVADLPAAPDATFIGVPREITVDIVRQLAARGAGGCVDRK